MQNWLDSIDAKLALAGTAGAIVALAVRPTRTVWGGFLTVFSGLASAVYVTPFINHFASLPENLYGGLGFCVGICAMPGAGWAMRRVSKWLDAKVK